MMMSKLFRPASNLLSKGLPGKRFKELHEYLCLREALNTKESETVLKDLEAASKKLKITPQEATEIVYLLQNDPSYYQGYLKEADLQQLEEIFELEYASSKVKHQGWNFDQYRYSLWQHYPELAQFTKPGPERAAGIKTLEDIFLKDGPSGARAQDADAITNSIPTFKQRIRDHVNSLEGQKEHKTAQVASRIKNILDEMVSLLEISPTLTYGRIRAFIALSKGLPETGRKEFEKKAIGSGETALQWTSPQEEAVAKQ